MTHHSFGPRCVAALAIGAIALFVVCFSGTESGLRSPVLRFGAALGGGLAGALLAPLFGRQGGWGGVLAFVAAIAATMLGGAVAGLVFDPGAQFGGPLMGAVMGSAMVLWHPLPALVWLAGFTALHLALRHWRPLQAGCNAAKVFL